MAALRFLPRVTPLEPAPSLDALLAALARRSGLVVLDGLGPGSADPWTLVGFDPLPRALAPLPRRPSELGDYAARLVDAAPSPVPGPFHGGFLGALAYDLGVEGEPPFLPPDPWAFPRLVGGLYVDFALYEPATAGRAPRAYLVLGEDPGDGRPPVAARLAALRAELAAAGEAPGPPRFEAPVPLARRVPSAEHRRRVELLRERIAAGELYQANLAHPFVGRTRGRPLDLHRLLRRASPAPHGGFLVWDDPERPGIERGALVSASPELLLEVEGDLARTRPIKGTAPRSEDPRRDARLAHGLLASEKDRAELAMIVDLSRNDLGRVARPGGVWVEDFPRLRSFPGVHHLTADVLARLAPGAGPATALAALFPGGSISGAPKLAAMQAIAELEGEGRGFFTGSLGFLDLRGRAVFDVLIRTFQWRPLPAAEDGADGEVRLHVGGGITWSSRAADEDQETLVKAAKLLAALSPARAEAGVLGAP